MNKVNIIIDGNNYLVDEEKTILEAARENNIYIPTLCYFEGLKVGANCRICIVEIEDEKYFKPACDTKVRDGMSIHTNSKSVREARKNILELILANHSVDCHHCLRIGSSKEKSLNPRSCEMCFWCDCVRDGFCELQTLAREYHVDVLPYIQHESDYEIDFSLESIIRNPNKCIKCRRCVDVCERIQTVNSLSIANFGHKLMVNPKFGNTMKESSCVKCGHCVDVCPTGAIYMKEHKDEVIYTAHSYEVDTVVQVSKDIIPEITSLYNVNPGDITMKHICSALHKIGFDKIITDKKSMYLSSVQGLKIIKENMGDKHVIITSSDAVVRFVNQNFPHMIEHINIYENSQRIFGKYVKSIRGENQIKSINITSVKEMAVQATDTKDVDYVINARELYRIFLRTGGAPAMRKPISFDDDCIDEVIYPSLLGKKEWTLQGEIESFELEIEGSIRKCAVAHNLGQVRTLLDGEWKNYDIISLMA
ncbi:[Fe-Fe] hydrogenase large subunit C-terminal domain-containing protein [Intestinibacter sp.]